MSNQISKSKAVTVDGKDLFLEISIDKS